MDVRYIDAHCHLQFEQYDDDREAIARQMREQGVQGIAIGCGLGSSRAAVALAEKHEHIFASVGLHPNHTDEPFDEAAFRALAEHPKVVGIGECGLDYFRPVAFDDAEKNRQKELFRKQIALAAELDKPLVIHARPTKGSQDAYRDVIEILTETKKTYPNVRGDMHFFVGGVEEAQAFVELGFTLSFTAVITFARDYDEVIKSVPLASILAETDAPYVAPATRRGQRNDPLAVIEVVAKIALIREEDLETVRRALLDNTKRMFALQL